MRVILHTVADYVRDLVKLAVIHLKKRMEDPSLDRLEPVLEIGDGPVLDYIGCVFEKVIVEYLLCVCH